MKILFIPISLVAYFIAIIGMAFIYNLIPSLKENLFLDYYIMPSVINIIGIIFYFFVGNAIIDTKTGNTSKSTNIILSIIIIVIQIIFSVLAYKSDEFNKIISSIVGCIVGILALTDSTKK